MGFSIRRVLGVARSEKRSNCRKVNPAVRRAAAAVAEALEQRQLLTVSWASINAPTYNLTPGQSQTFSLSASSDYPSSVTGWSVSYGDGSTDTLTGNPSSVSHTYSAAGNYSVYATASDDDPSSYTTSTFIDIQRQALSASGPYINTTQYAPFAGSVATFSDPNTPLSTYDASIYWGDGNWDIGSITGSSGSYTVSGTHSYSTSGYYSPYVYISDSSGDSITAPGSASVAARYPLSVMANSISATQGQSFTGAFATFSDPNSTLASSYSATLSFGDGTFDTGTITGSGGNYTVTDSHTYSIAGSYYTDITVSDSFGESTPFSGYAAVGLVPLSISGYNIQTSGTDYSGTVGIIHNAATDFYTTYTGSLTLDSSTYSDVTFTPDGHGNLLADIGDISGLSDGDYTGTLAITESGGTEVLDASANITLYVADNPISPMGYFFSPTVNIPWSGTVANFADSDPYSSASDYSASTDWADGTSATADTVASDGSGYWDTNGSHTYTIAGYYSPNTSISTIGFSTSASSSANVNLASIAMSSTTMTLDEGQSYSGTIATLTDDAGAYADPADYTAVFALNGVNYPVTFVMEYPGTYAVQASFPAQSAGTAYGTINVSEYSGGQSVSTSGYLSIGVNDLPITATAAPAIAAIPMSWWSGTVASFTDPDPNAQASNYTATIDWGDGTSAGTIASDGSGGWIVSGSYSYASAGSYTVSVVINDNGGSTASANESAGVAYPPPSTPTLTTSTSSTSAVDLSWYSSGYVSDLSISRSVDGGSYTYLTDLLSSYFNYTDTALTDGTSYSYQITANGPGGSATSADAYAMTLLAPPTALPPVETGPNSVDLSWTNNSQTAIGFEIDRKDSSGIYENVGLTWGAYTPGQTVTYTDTTAVDGTANYYEIRALSGGLYYASSAPSSAVSATTPLAPPASLTAVAASSSQMDLSWTNQSATAAYVQVERSTNGTTFTALSPLLPASATSFADTGLAEDTQYWYRIKSVNGSDTSAATATATAFTYAPVDALVAVPASTSEIDLSWNLNTIGATAIEIDRSTDGTTFAALTSSLPGTATGFADTDLSENTHYWYKVRAIEPGGDSAFTPVADAYTLAAISDVSATSSTADTVDLSWTLNLPTAGVTFIEVDRSIDNSTFTTVTSTLAADATAYSDTGLGENTHYYYRVHAITSSGDSEEPATADATTLAAVDTLAANAASGSEIDLSWNLNMTDATNIEVDRSSDGGTVFTALMPLLAGDATGYNDTGLNDNADYTYQVRAIRPSGASAFTAAVDAVTGADIDTLAVTAAKADEIDLTWNLNVTGATNIEIDRSTDGTTYTPLIASLSGSATGYNDTTVSEGTHYWYEARALFTSGDSAFSEPVDAWALPLQNLAAAAATSSAVLTWTNTSSGGSYVEIDRSINGTDWGATSLQAADATTYTDIELTEATQYWYRIQIIYDGTASGFGDPISICTLPLAPTGLQVASTSPTAVGLAWTNNSAGSPAYFIERSDDGGTDFAIIDITDAGAISYTDSSVQDGASYVYNVAAATADFAGMNASGNVSTSTLLQSPTKLTAVANGQTEIDLSWSSPSQDATGYTIYNSSDGLTFGQLAMIPYADTVTYSDTSVAAATQMYYRIVATNGTTAFDSAPSNTAIAATGPIIMIGASGIPYQGSPYTFISTVTHAPGEQDPITGWTIDWGDSTITTPTGDPGSFTHTYLNPGYFTVTATTADQCFTGTLQLHVQQVDGSLTLETDESFATVRHGTAGAPFATSATYVGPAGHDVLTWSVNWGDGTVESFSYGDAVATDPTLTPEEFDTKIFHHTYADSDDWNYNAYIQAVTDQRFYASDCSVELTGDLSWPDNEMNVLVGDGGAASNSEGTPRQLSFVAPDGPTDSPTTYTINWGDGTGIDSVSAAAGIIIYTPIHYYANEANCLITIRDGSTVVAYTSANLGPAAPTLATAPEQAVGADQSVTEPIDYTLPGDTAVVAVVDWHDGTGTHTVFGSGGEANAVLAAASAVTFGEYSQPGIMVFNAQGDMNTYHDVAVGPVYVWNTVIGDGTPNDLLMASPDGTQNQQDLTVYFPHPLGEALTVTLTASDAADAYVFDPDVSLAAGGEVIGGDVDSYTFTIPADGGEYKSFKVGAINGDATFDGLHYTVAGEETTGCSPDFETQLADGVDEETDVANSGTAEASSMAVKIALKSDPNTDPGADGSVAHPYNWLVGQVADITATITAPASQKLKFAWDVPGSILGNYAHSDKAAAATSVGKSGEASTDNAGNAVLEVKFFWVTTQYDPSQAAGPDQDKVQISVSGANAPQPALNFRLFSPTILGANNAAGATIIAGVVGSDPTTDIAVVNQNPPLAFNFINIGLNGNVNNVAWPHNGIDLGVGVSTPQPQGGGQVFAAGTFRFVQLITPSNAYKDATTGAVANSKVFGKRGVDLHEAMFPGGGPPVVNNLFTATPYNNAAKDPDAWKTDDGVKYSGDSPGVRPSAIVLIPNNQGQAVQSGYYDTYKGQYSAIILNEVFDTYIMYLPPGGSNADWIPLAVLPWSFSVTAALVAPAKNQIGAYVADPWKVIAGAAKIPATLSRAKAEPEWDSIITSVDLKP